MTELLENGVRFIDFRIVWSKSPDTGLYDWFCLHMMQTRVSAMSLLQDLKSFLQNRPQEVVFLWITRHSDSCSGFDGSSAEQQQALFLQMEKLFGDLLFDHGQQSLNETTFSTLWKTNQRLILSVAAWETFTRSSSLAMNACSAMHIWDPPDGVVEQVKTQAFQVAQMRNSSATRLEMRRQNRIWATFWSTSTPKTQLISTALTTLFTLSSKEKEDLMSACANSFHIPNSTFCPQTLLEVTSLGNYYLQRVLMFGLENGLQFPMVVYGDHLTKGGFAVNDGENFGFVAAVVLNSFRSFSDCGDRCEWLATQLVPRLVNDPSRGKLKDWPKLAQ